MLACRILMLGFGRIQRYQVDDGRMDGSRAWKHCLLLLPEVPRFAFIRRFCFTYLRNVFIDHCDREKLSAGHALETFREARNLSTKRELESRLFFANIFIPWRKLVRCFDNHHCICLPFSGVVFNKFCHQFFSPGIVQDYDFYSILLQQFFTSNKCLIFSWKWSADLRASNPSLDKPNYDSLHPIQQAKASTVYTWTKTCIHGCSLIRGSRQSTSILKSSCFSLLLACPISNHFLRSSVYNPHSRPLITHMNSWTALLDAHIVSSSENGAIGRNKRSANRNTSFLGTSFCLFHGGFEARAVGFAH